MIDDDDKTVESQMNMRVMRQVQIGRNTWIGNKQQNTKWTGQKF
jgi:hypothetical protein